MNEVEYTEDAKVDIREIREYLEIEAPAVMESVLRNIFATVDLIIEHPAKSSEECPVPISDMPWQRQTLGALLAESS